MGEGEVDIRRSRRGFKKMGGFCAMPLDTHWILGDWFHWCGGQGKTWSLAFHGLGWSL